MSGLRGTQIGLRTRITVVFGGLALVVSITLAVGTYLTARHYLVIQREQTASRQAFVDASFIREGLLTAGAEVDEVLASTSPPAGAVLVLRRDGQWYSSSLSAGREAIPSALRSSVADGHAASTWARLSGEPVVAVGTPLTAVGADFFEISQARELSSTLTTLALALGGFSLLTTVGGALIGRAAAPRVVAPLDGIALASARIAGGDTATRLQSTTDPDLSVIVGSFNAMVEALQERLDRDARFAADVSHELRSPVMALMTTIEVLEQDSDGGGRRTESLALLRREVHRLSHALEQLLALGRLEAGVDERERQPLSLGELLSNTLTQMHKDTVVDQADTPVIVEGDKGALRRMVVNVVDNAEIHGGGVVRLGLTRQGRWAVITVDDAGPGIPEAERQRVFERFARAGSRAARPGTGLGLSLVTETVRAHGGDVRCTASPEGGARFTVRLPLSPSATDLQQ